MLEIGNGGMTAEEYRTHMSLWSMLAAPLIAGNDLRSMSEETKSILLNQEVIAVDQDPAAKPVQTFSTDGKVEILSRPMADGSLVVALFNRGGEPAHAGFKWSSLPLGSSGKNLHVRDLWRHTKVPVAGEEYTATVPAHGVNLLRIEAAR
jgi:alpha-galactosidase